MTTYLVAFNPKTANHDNNGLAKAIQEAYQTSCRCLDSTWIVVSEKDVVQIRNSLMSHVDPHDLLLVCEITKNMSWTALPPEIHDWLTKLL